MKLYSFLWSTSVPCPHPYPSPPQKKTACQLSFAMCIKTLTISRCLLFGEPVFPMSGKSKTIGISQFPDHPRSSRLMKLWVVGIPDSQGWPTYENQALGSGVSISVTSTGRVKLHKNFPSARDVQLSKTRAITPFLSFGHTRKSSWASHFDVTQRRNLKDYSFSFA